MASPISMALIPYTPSQTPMEFIRSEVERSIPSALSSVNKIVEIVEQHSYIQESSQSNRKIDSQFNATRSSESNEESDELFIKLFIDRWLNSSPEPLLFHEMLNGDEIAPVFQSQAGFTVATDNKPILATHGCGPCVAVGGYDPTNKIAFLVHFAIADEVLVASNLIFHNICKLAKQRIDAPIQLHLRGGYLGVSENLIAAIKLWMKQRKDLPMEIASEDILHGGGCKDLSIDSRNGTTSEYDPKAYPQVREMSKLEVILALKSPYAPNIYVTYTPNQ